MPLCSCFCGEIWSSICQFFKKDNGEILEMDSDVISVPVVHVPVAVTVAVRFDPTIIPQISGMPPLGPQNCKNSRSQSIHFDKSVKFIELNRKMSR